MEVSRFGHVETEGRPSRVGDNRGEGRFGRHFGQGRGNLLRGSGRSVQQAGCAGTGLAIENTRSYEPGSLSHGSRRELCVRRNDMDAVCWWVRGKGQEPRTLLGQVTMVC